MKNWVAFMPNFLAVTKWPYSCSMIEADRATTKMIQPSSRSSGGSPPCAPAPRASAPAPGARPAIGFEHVLQANRPEPAPSCSEITRITVSTIPVNEMAPARNAATHSSLAALYTAGQVPPARPTCRASETAGKASSSSGSNVQVCALVQSTAGAASGTRSGQASASAIGIRMSGGLAWASVEPSVNSTIECTTDCGCTTTSMRSNGTSNSRCASISSSPLFTSVAELTVTTGPMCQVGWARACSGVTPVSSSRRRPRNGPPLAVTTSRRTSSARPPRRHCAIAECSESTGTICPGAARPATRARR